MRQFIAGAASAGLSDASSSVEARSFASPCAALASRSAVAGRDHDQIGLPAQFDMAHFRFVGQREQVFINLFAAQAGERQRRHELRAGLGQNRPHLDLRAAQQADQFQALVGGDAAADDQQNGGFSMGVVMAATVLNARAGR